MVSFGGFGENVVEIVIKARDEFSNAINDVKLSLAAVGVVAAGVFAGMTLVMKGAIQESIEFEAAQNRLARILKTSRKASQEQIDVLFDQAKALDKVGVATEKNILVTQSQLSTFDLEVESIRRLTPAVLDYVIAEKGASASTDEFRALTNGLAQALNGQFASLTRTGFVLDEVTKKQISSGTETERVDAIVRVLNSTYKDFNATALNTAEGGLLQLNKEFTNMKQIIGDALMPILLDLAQAITPIVQLISSLIERFPNLTAVILIAITAIAGATAATIALTLAVVAFQLAGAPLILSIVLISVAIAGIIAILVLLGLIVFEVLTNFDEFKVGLAMIWNDIVGFFESGVNKAIKALNALISAFNKIAGKLGFKKGIGLIGEVSLGRIDIEAMIAEINARKKATDEIGKQNEALTEQESIIKRLSAFRVISETGDIFNPAAFSASEFMTRSAFEQAKRGSTITVNIENINSLDPEEVAEALQKAAEKAGLVS